MYYARQGSLGGPSTRLVIGSTWVQIPPLASRLKIFIQRLYTFDLVFILPDQKVMSNDLEVSTLQGTAHRAIHSRFC